MTASAALVPLATTYPVALVLMAFRGWWTGNFEALFAAPLTALAFTLFDYPIALAVLWVISRPLGSAAPLVRVAVAALLSLLAYFLVIKPLDRFSMPASFMAAVVALSALTWSRCSIFVLERRRRAEEVGPDTHA